MKFFDGLSIFLGKQIWLRRAVLFLIDVSLGAITFYLAHLLRLEGSIPDNYLGMMKDAYPYFLLCRALPFIVFNFYNRYWEYSSLEDLFQIFKAVVTGSFLFFFFSTWKFQGPPFPKSIILIDLILIFCFLGGVRLGWRLWKEARKNKASLARGANIRSFIFGAGDSGISFLRYARKQFPQFDICGFIDNDPQKIGQVILGVKVLNNGENLVSTARSHGVKDIFIASDQMDSQYMSQIVETCDRHGLHYKMISTVFDLTGNEIKSAQIRKIEIADLLGREPVSLDFHSIRDLIRGKQVLITGAGGSIGSELCHQILNFEPKEMIMVDIGENYLHELSTKLGPFARTTKVDYQFVSVTNQKKMTDLFFRTRPHVVFHAAAHKHVPIMEAHPEDALFNNVFGTRVIADLAVKYGVQKFVLVSTDKVVRPTSVMGMTKKIAEFYVQNVGAKSQTRFITVRFGNVLGSNGSVVPLFQRQIEAGGPVTITHPDMKRYFMLISEAAQLIVQAAAIGTGREIFILEMGEQIKISDLARKMIRLAGYTPDEDIKIEYTGIRPGEKLYEELVDEGEVVVPTFHKKIKILRQTFTPGESFDREFDALCQLTLQPDSEKIRTSLKEFISVNMPKMEAEI